jgi:hypothetical protein
LNEVISIVKSETGPRNATKKEHDNSRKLLNQFLAADGHLKPVVVPVTGTEDMTVNIQKDANATYVVPVAIVESVSK